MSKISPYFLFALALVAGFAISGCDVDDVTALLDGLRGEATQVSTSSEHSKNAATARDINSITIASFNIQVFGQSKLRKTEVMEDLAETVRRFDVVAIQEIRSKDDVMGQFTELINADGHHYRFVLGPRLGRSKSKEQYAFVYDTTRIEFVEGTAYTCPDDEDDLHREPFVASFRVLGQPTGEEFTFSLVNIHTDPDLTDEELDALDNAFEYVQTKNPQEDDVILLGDLNVDAEHLGELGQLPNVTWVIAADTMTNTRRNKSYDNIVFDQHATSEFTGVGGVFDFQTEFELSREDAIRVSDHFPVWGQFSAREGGAAANVAKQPDNSVDR